LKVTISRYGEKGVLLTWEAVIEQNVLQAMTQFVKYIEKKETELADVHHAYHEVLLQYKKPITDFEHLKAHLQSELLRLQKIKKAKSTLWTIPVCYDDTLIDDLPIYLEQNNITLSELIALHTSPIYTIYFIGFLPGFLYLGGLNQKLSIDRKTSPSRLIKKGTVAIGGSQTGVYPQDSPGGWYGIGYTPISFFDSTKKTPTWAKPGDKILFEPVDSNELQAIKEEIKEGSFTLKSTSYES